MVGTSSASRPKAPTPAVGIWIAKPGHFIGASGARIVLLPNEDSRALDGAPQPRTFIAGPA